METNKLSALDSPQSNQSVIQLKVKRAMIPVDASIIARLKNELAAFNLTITQSGLTDQEICAEFSPPFNAGQWTRIRNGEAHFPLEKNNDDRGYRKLYDICGNEALLQYQNYRGGYETLAPKRKSELERALEASNKRADAAEFENAILLKAIHGKAGSNG